MSDIDTTDQDAVDQYLESDAFEALYEDLWQRALSAAGQHIDELGMRDLIPSPEWSLANAITGMNGDVPAEAQAWALDWAASIGEEMIRRTEIELAEMRRALAALQQPRSQLLRSQIGLVRSGLNGSTVPTISGSRG